MSIGQPFFNPQARTCPKCGTLQESPGSTVCEQCGADLPGSGADLPESRANLPGIGVVRPAPRPARVPHPARVLSMHTRGVVRRLLGLGVWLIKRSITAALWPVFLALRIISLGLRVAVGALVLVLLIVGLSYVPGVQAKVPLMKQVGPIARQVLQRGEDLGTRLLAVILAKTPPALRLSRPASSSQKPPSTRPIATQPLTIESTPSGATVQLNARRVGKTPLTLSVAPGTYKVTLSRPGSVSLTRTITVQEGKAASLSVELAALPATPSQVVPSQVPTPSPTQDPTPPPPRDRHD
jgi:hypothetical protein